MLKRRAIQHWVMYLALGLMSGIAHADNSSTNIGAALSQTQAPVGEYKSRHAAVEVQKHSNILWTQVDDFPLTADIYTPKNAKKSSRPVLVIYHGGGWLLNTKDIMDDMARYMAEHGNLVVVNVNYRLLADQNNTVTVNKIVEDAMGAVLWVKDNIRRYGGDPKKIAITGDSAGGHLAGMVMFAGRALSSDSFSGKTLGFKPSYLPKRKKAEDIAKKDGLRVQAVLLSYTAFDFAAIAANGFETDDNPFWGWANVKARGTLGSNIRLETHPEYYQAVSPLHYLTDAKQYRLPPQFIHAGTEDKMTSVEMAQGYVDKVRAAGHSIEMKSYANLGHGFLDSGCNDYTNGCFKDLAPPTLDDMIDFIKGVFKY